MTEFYEKKDQFRTGGKISPEILIPPEGGRLQARCNLPFNISHEVFVLSKVLPFAMRIRTFSFTCTEDCMQASQEYLPCPLGTSGFSAPHKES